MSSTRARPSGGSGSIGQRTPVGVLVMSYGTPSSRDDVEAFYTDVRRGRPPAPEQLADLRRRYDAIGGTSPMAARTKAQADALQTALEARGFYRTLSGTKHSHPSVEEAVGHLAAEGISKAVGLVLAPHYSSMSVGEYVERAGQAASHAGITMRFIRSWHLEEAFVSALATRLGQALSDLPDEGRSCVEVVFTAHSLPSRILETDDPYAEQLRESAEQVARRAGLARWRLAWQSAGRTPEPWLGPDLLEVIRELPKEGVTAVVVCPQGFVSDHLEVLYDIDIDARRVANEAGLQLVRTSSINDDPAVIDALANLVVEASDGL